MAEFKVVIGDPKSKKAYQKAVSQADVEKLIGMKMGDKFHGELVGLTGYELRITGGSDTAGFPMRSDVHGQGRSRLLLAESTGFRNIKNYKKSKKGKEIKTHIKIKGRRARRTVRGNTISLDTAQINCKVVKEGAESIAKLLGIEEKSVEVPKVEEAKAE